MNNNGENGKKSEVDREIADAENLLEKGGQDNFDIAWNALMAFKRQKSKLSRPQNQKVAKLLNSISEKKNKEINESLDKLQKSIDEKDVTTAAEPLSVLLTNNRFLSIEQERRLIILKEKFLNINELKNDKN